MLEYIKNYVIYVKHGIEIKSGKCRLFNSRLLWHHRSIVGLHYIKQHRIVSWKYSKDWWKKANEVGAINVFPLVSYCNWVKTVRYLSKFTSYTFRYSYRGLPSESLLCDRTSNRKQRQVLLLSDFKSRSYYCQCHSLKFTDTKFSTITLWSRK